MTQIRNIVDADFESIIKLNDSEVEQTSPMDMDRLGSLARISCYCKVAVFENETAAFLLALREGAPYENDNSGSDRCTSRDPSGQCLVQTVSVVAPTYARIT